MLSNTLGVASIPNRTTHRQPRPAGSGWPWTQTLLVAVIGAAAIYLVSSHWVHILDASPYLWVVLMMGMHVFMHRGHGGHAGHGGQGRSGGSVPPTHPGGSGHVH
ncbi:DUF2933 domain-containing protein [Arthrobacter silvisoli]|uniref:DUF2933 domain-containing protein n=1 Tax=Arthrobacter silvisoli TaxID=2291022 RepID=UPI000E21A815